MWAIEPTDCYVKKMRRLRKRPSGTEIAEALEANLLKYAAALEAGLDPMHIRGGFIHPEKHHGLVALDTKGYERKLPESRMYVYADKEAEVLHIITVGPKKDQRRDLRESRKYVDTLRGERSDG